jgi:hypothetical protein
MHGRIPSVFQLKLRDGLACGIARKTRRIGLWIVASDAITPNGITGDLALLACSELNVTLVR